MQNIARHQLLNCTAKQAGFMSTVWFAINSGLSYDRTPEGITPGFLERAGYA